MSLGVTLKMVDRVARFEERDREGVKVATFIDFGLYTKKREMRFVDSELATQSIGRYPNLKKWIFQLFKY